jgi:hypothetical protein
MQAFSLEHTCLYNDIYSFGLQFLMLSKKNFQENTIC